MIGFDLYPLQEWCRPERMDDVFYSQQELVKLSGAAAHVPVDRGRRLEVPRRRDGVTPAIDRAESWLAIAGGAHGLGFWPAQWPSANARAIAGVGAGRRADRPGDLHAERSPRATTAQDP